MITPDPLSALAWTIIGLGATLAAALLDRII